VSEPEHAAIEGLRDARGVETVTFADVADHLTDYVRRRPEDAPVVERIAHFLTAVERVDHHHRSGTEGSSVTEPQRATGAAAST
jgi:hypothetical protein